MGQKLSRVILLLFLFLRIPAFPEDAVSYYQKAKEAFFLENYDEAVDYLRRSLALNSRYLEALELLAYVYFENGNYEYAYLNINKALTFAPNRSDLILFSADIETRLKMFDLAEAKYKNIISTDPLNMTAFNGLANLYLETDRKILARDTLFHILKSDPQNYKALLKLSFYYETEDPIKADTYYQKNIQYNSLEDTVYFYYSIFLFKSGKVKAALEMIRTAIDIKKKEEYLKYLGKYYLYLQRPDEALNVLREVVAEEDEGEIYYYLAHAYFMTGEYEQAINGLMKALGKNNEDEIAALFLDEILVKQYPVTEKRRKMRSLYYERQAHESKKNALFQTYLYSLRKAILLDPYHAKARLELAEYYRSNNYPERYFRELNIAAQYSPDQEIRNRIEMEKRNLAYRLGNAWKLNQYNVENEVFLIPLFVEPDISNRHYKVEELYSGLLQTLSYEKYTFEVVPYFDRLYSDSEKMTLSRRSSSFSPYFLELSFVENKSSIEVKLILKNSLNGAILHEFRTYQAGNGRIIGTASSLLSQLEGVVPFGAKLIKVSGDRAIINAGRKSGVKLKDTYYIIKNKRYQLQPESCDFLVEKGDIKGTAVVVKVDENISEIKFKDNDFFKDIDVNDLVIHYGK